jgi:hypothetical protein
VARPDRRPGTALRRGPGGAAAARSGSVPGSRARRVLDVERDELPGHIPEGLPTVSIIYPRESDRAYDERYLHLWGVASTPSREEVASDAFVWYLDDTEVGKGADIWIDNPGPGRYDLRLEASGRTGTGIATSTFEVSKA